MRRGRGEAKLVRYREQAPAPPEVEPANKRWDDFEKTLHAQAVGKPAPEKEKGVVFDFHNHFA